MHPTSLPSRHGIGDLGQEAHAFIQFLAESGQRWWQMLPVGPTGYGNSPYQSHSSFAGNKLLIDLDDLLAKGWLAPGTFEDEPRFPEDQVDFDAVGAFKERVLRLAHDGWKKQGDDPRYHEFVAANEVWLDDYVLYQALKDAHSGLPWYQWEHELVIREPAAMAGWRDRLHAGISYHSFVQYVFELQWQALRGACREHGVMLIGDVPIFVAHDSADVWARPELFYLDGRGQPLFVAGVPPDYFSETGQLWGNPLYKWEVHAAEDYSWWVSRLSHLLAHVDLVRIDHFRGFEAYWEIPVGSHTAASGRWVPGPGRHFFEAMRRRLGSLPLVAEDLGLITPAVEALRDEFALPGMRVLQFGFGADQAADKALPHRHVPHCLVYTGTHDNDTTVGWFTSTDVMTTQSAVEIAAERAFALRLPELRWNRDPLGHDPPGVLVSRRHGDHSIAGYHGAGLKRADEHAGDGRGELALAVPERADRRNNARPARGANCHLQPVEWNGSRRQGTAEAQQASRCGGADGREVLSKRAQTPPWM